MFDEIGHSVKMWTIKSQKCYLYVEVESESVEIVQLNLYNIQVVG